MRSIRAILFFLTFITLAFLSQGQNKYAILIGGPIEKEHWRDTVAPGWYPKEYQDFFWTDIFLMRQLLINKFDYPAENVKFIFDDGHDYSPPLNPDPYPSRYQKDPNAPDITAPDHDSCTHRNVKVALQNLNTNENDFVFIYIFTHGRYPLGGQPVPVPYGVLIPQHIRLDYQYDENDYMYADEFTNLVAGIKAQKKVIWMQPCYSGGFKTYFNNHLNSSPFIVNYSCGALEEASQADDSSYLSVNGMLPFFENEPLSTYDGWEAKCHHGEFSYHLYSALNGETPTIGETKYMNGTTPIPLSLADINNDGIISVKEAYDWGNTYQSLQYEVDGEHFDYQESVAGLSNTTSLKYPNIVSSITDLKIDSTNTGIYGVTSNVIVNGNNKSLAFGPHSKIYLLNNAKIIVQGGATLTIHDSAEIYGNGQNSVRVENGTLNIGQNVLFSCIDADQVFMGLYLSGNSTTTQISHATFHRAHLWNESLNLVLDHTSFDHVATSDEDIYGVYSTAGDVTITQSSFIGASVCLILQNPDDFPNKKAIVQHSTFNGGGINVLGYKNFKIDYNILENPSDNAVTAHYAGNGTSGNQSISQNNISNSVIGVLLNNTNANVICNNIHGCQRGVYIGNHSNTTMIGVTSLTQKVKNCFNEEIYTEKDCFPYRFSYNEIVHESNANGSIHPLVRYINYPVETEQKDVENNCWGINFVHDLDLIGGDSVTFVDDPKWCPGNPTPIDPSIDMFANAMNEYDSGNYTEAKSIFKTIIELSPKSIQAQSSMKILFQIEEFAENDYAALQQYFTSNDSIIADTSLSNLGEYLAIRCNEKIENWPDEIAWLENKIMNPESESDSIFAILDLSYVYLLMENSPTKSAYIGTLPKYKPKSLKQFVPYRDTLCSLLPGGNSKQLLTRINALNDGELLQNVPNPVLESTDIYFKLNSQGNILITIIDIFNRIVETYNETNLSTGVHKVNMNFSDLTPGMYFYTLNVNGKNSDVKKLIKL